MNRIVKEKYAKYGVDVNQALKKLSKIRISIHCWQGDDVRGFMKDSSLDGGIQVTGNYPGRARNVKELRDDLSQVFKLVAGKFNLNLHSTYLDTNEDIDLDKIEPRHFASWVEFAKQHNLGLDFNPTCFGHKNTDMGLTLSSSNEEIRTFWVNHCIRSRKISEYFGKELGMKSVCNLWIPDGLKESPISHLNPRLNLNKSLSEIYSYKVNQKYVIDTLEPKLFGIGLESYTVGSYDFYYGYALKKNLGLCIDSGHFNVLEDVSDKLSSLSMYFKDILLHLSRPMRWDSDHVVIDDDMLKSITSAIVRDDLLKNIRIGLDYFDGSINRVVAWVIGIRAVQKALLRALLEPRALLLKIESEKDYSKKMALLEELKSLPYGLVFEEYCKKNNIPTDDSWYEEANKYYETLKEQRL